MMRIGNLARRGSVGLWYSRAKTQAVGDAENKGTTDGFLEIAPSEGGNQTDKRVKREF
jgi:hypothetical protein